MKNIMIIDGAVNCAYDIYQATDDEFKLIFPMQDQDIQFIEDIDSDPQINDALTNIWTRPISKKITNGIHGILFFELTVKKEFYPNKRDSDLDFIGRPGTCDSN